MSDTSIATLHFLVISVCMKYPFPSPHSQSLVSFALNWVFIGSMLMALGFGGVSLVAPCGLWCIVPDQGLILALSSESMVS